MRRTILAGLLLPLLFGAILRAQPMPQRPHELVRSWYERYLGREPDYPGARGWVNLLRGRAPPAQVLAGIVGSDEYYNRAGGTPEGFARMIFLDFIGREPSPVELKYWARKAVQEGRTAVALTALTTYPQSWQQAPVPVPNPATPPPIPEGERRIPMPPP